MDADKGKRSLRAKKFASGKPALVLEYFLAYSKIDRFNRISNVHNSKTENPLIGIAHIEVYYLLTHV